MKKIILVGIFCFSFLFLFSQNEENMDTLKTSPSNTIKDHRIDQLNETYKSSFKLKGYRIQIYSGNKRQPARQARQSFSQIYHKTKAHECYEQPYFKVRVGDFRTKLEALKFKNELIKHFPNCFIVKDNIDIKEVNN